MDEPDMPWCEHCQCYHHETAEHIPPPSLPLPSLLMGATVSVTGTTITIECDDHDIKDRLLTILTGG